MTKYGMAMLMRCIGLSQLVVLSVQGGLALSVGNVHDRGGDVLQYSQLTGYKVAMETGKRGTEVTTSGLKGTTSVIVRSGIPGGQTTGGPRSVEFAVVPIEEGKPVYHKATFVKSDQQGNYEVALPPGQYWIGPKAKALDPVHYRPGALELAEQVAVVKEGEFTRLDLVEEGYAP
jgi:hypothetical protein